MRDANGTPRSAPWPPEILQVLTGMGMYRPPTPALTFNQN